MGVGDEQLRDEILVLGGHARQPLAAAALGAEFGQWRALDIATMGYRDDHLFLLDQVSE